ncbi:LysE family transporter [Ferrovibrio sp. MS7]|uniref:LysE family translocator n=1 Tax=Ferrovibrio plantarum TaxID=3119164 RepID=UPI003136B13F
MLLENLLMLGKGGLAGFVIAAPVGPVGVLCVQRTLALGAGSGLMAGLGAAFADALYGCIAAFGLSLIAEWLQSHEILFRLIGGAFLLFMGAKMLRARHDPAAPLPSVPRDDLVHGLLSTFLLTATNPITIVAFLGIFAFLGIGAVGVDQAQAGWLVLGVFIGSSVWWLSLAALAGRFRRQLAEGGLATVNRLSGLLLLGFALYGLGSVLWMWSQGIR